ncbi:MAG: hypothetical protein DSY58_01930 [Desulfobulbus sp.]|nr:MAG: hypothetical protein DSY58_01930 [Desulfobulbus sp.]
MLIHTRLFMVVGGVVITVSPADKREVELALIKLMGVQVYGSDEEGNIIATITSEDEATMNTVIENINVLAPVTRVHIAYLNNDTVDDNFM